MKRPQRCANCGATESAQIYVGDPWCSEACQKVYQDETAYLEEATRPTQPRSEPLVGLSRYTEVIEALRDATIDLEECLGVLDDMGQATSVLEADLTRFNVLLGEDRR